MPGLPSPNRDFTRVRNWRHYDKPQQVSGCIARQLLISLLSLYADIIKEKIKLCQEKGQLQITHGQEMLKLAMFAIRNKNKQ